MEMLKSAIKELLDRPEFLAMLLGFLWQTYGRVKQVKDGKDLVDVLINTLKDVDKMKNDHEFDPKLLEKAEGIATTLKTSKKVVAEAKEVLSGKENAGFWPIASYKGKKIYASQILDIFKLIKKSTF